MSVKEKENLYEIHKEENDLIRTYWVNRSIRGGGGGKDSWVPPEGTDYFYDRGRAWDLLLELFRETNNVKLVLEGPGRIEVLACWNHKSGKDAGYKYSGWGSMEAFAITRAFVDFAKHRD